MEVFETIERNVYRKKTNWCRSRAEFYENASPSKLDTNWAESARRSNVDKRNKHRLRGADLRYVL